jgi:hypothetical protein
LDHNPLDWVNVRYSKSVFEDYCTRDSGVPAFYGGSGDYWTCNSFFWNIVWRVACDYHAIDRSYRDWSERVACSNLYKISKEEGNPTEEMKRIQKEFAIRLFQKELDELRPKYCILPTNLPWWKPFGQALNTRAIQFDKSKHSKIQAYEVYENSGVQTKIIVTERPYPMGNADEYAHQITSLLI